MSETMRGLFFIVKGQYAKGAEPSFTNKVTNDTSYIGGFDPYDKNTSEWYMVLDCKTFHCVSCGSDYNKALRGVFNNIIKHKGDAKRYFKHVSSITSDDYYETHYLGKSPLTHDQRVKKAEGRCPRVSPAMREMYGHIYSEYGDFFLEDIVMMEDLAYDQLREEKPHNKTKRLMSKTKPKSGVMMKEPPKKEVIETPTTLKKVIPKKVTVKIKKLPVV